MGEGTKVLTASQTVGDLISVSRVPAVVSLEDLSALRDRLSAGQGAGAALDDLLAGYHLGDPDTRGVFEALLRGLARQEQRGDAFLVQGVYGSGKSHLLAVTALLCGHPNSAWPVFLRTHPEYQRASAGFSRPRLVAAIPLDEYPSRTHSLEMIVLSALERELAHRHGIRVALTEEAHLLDLVDRYVVPQAGGELNAMAEAEAGAEWRALRARSSARAARVALAFLARTGFPLDWRRSRAEAWGVLRRALDRHGLDGPVVLLDELGMFLAGKARTSLNQDAAFLQYLAHRTGSERCWLVCVTQRGIEEVGDIDHRTLRQMRDRFRSPLTLDLTEIGWVIGHRVVRRRDEGALQALAQRLHGELDGDAAFTPEELGRAYPLNPLALAALQGASEKHLSRVRSAIRMLQEAAHEQDWLARPAERLITPDAVFDLVQEELADSPAGQRHLGRYEMVAANAARILPGREAMVLTVMKTLLLVSLAGLRWSPSEIRSSLLGCGHPALWREPDLLHEVLSALYRWGSGVERTWSEVGRAHTYHVDVSSDAPARIRRRINELTREMRAHDSWVARGGADACRQPSLPLAGLMEPRTVGVDWCNARRMVSLVCCDVGELASSAIANLLGAFASPDTRENGRLHLAMPGTDLRRAEEHWRSLADGRCSRFARSVLAWFPAPLTAHQWEQLVEHSALSRMAADRTLSGRGEAEFRQKVRQRWSESERFVQQILARAYYRGRIVDLTGEVAVPPERLESMEGDWESAVAAAFAGAFHSLFPKFPSIAPERRLAGRAQTNQIINQFIRRGSVRLPPASTLEAHIRAYAMPLGLAEERSEGEREFHLVLKNADLAAAVLSAVPSPSTREEVAPEHVVAFRDLAGRLAKGEWGLTPEQTELLVAALIRTGHLVALDAFLQPIRLEAVAVPLADNLPYLMRGRPLAGAAAREARALWEAATGKRSAAWDLPAQERAWDDLIGWANAVARQADDRRAAIARAAEAFGHPSEAWSFALSALARAEAVAAAVEPAHTSREGLSQLVKSAARLPGGVAESERQLTLWRACADFLDDRLGEMSRLWRLLSDLKLRCPAGSLLRRQHEQTKGVFSPPERLVTAPDAAAASVRRFLTAYRRHYLAWHAQVYAADRFQRLSRLRQSPSLETARRLGAVGLCSENVRALDEEIARALASRCLAGDPLPGSSAVCPSCRLELGRDLALPDPEKIEARIRELLMQQQQALRSQEAVLLRRLRSCPDPEVRDPVTALLQAAAGNRPLPAPQLTPAAVGWLRIHLRQPKAKQRALAELERALRGKEATKRQVIAEVERWLSARDDDVVEII